jgi:hypothetical protein
MILGVAKLEKLCDPASLALPSPRFPALRNQQGCITLQLNWQPTLCCVGVVGFLRTLFAQPHKKVAE